MEKLAATAATLGQVGTQCAAEANKAYELSRSIDGIDYIGARLSELIDRINGSPLKVCGDAETQPPVNSLAEIMAGGAGTINEKCDNIHKQIEEILQLLF